MKTSLKLFVVGLVMFGVSSGANAFVLTYSLEVSQTTWKLKAKTDAPGGIASFVVDLTGVATGVSDAPRGTFGGGAVNGFTLGNAFAANQAFAGQNTSNAASIVYGLGNTDVLPAAFGAPVPFTLIGSGIRDAGGYVTLYHGTNSGNFSATGKIPQPAAFGAVFGSVGTAQQVAPVIGPGVNLTVVYTWWIAEPSTFILAALVVPTLAYAARCRRLSRRMRA